MKEIIQNREKNTAEFISNDYTKGRKVLSTIEEELLHCDSFVISVAFITMSGITPLLQTLKELEEKNISGKILTTDYLAFSEPRALQKLSAFSNIELKMHLFQESKIGFHTKGYIFRKGDIYKTIVGSSNMTLSALTLNREWNTKIVSEKNDPYLRDLFDEFNALWFSNFSCHYTSIVDQYQTLYQKKYLERKTTDERLIPSKDIQPNSMQREVIDSLSSIVEQGGTKALLISATGTGKTYASAFALKEQKPKRVLFLVHREQIAKQAMRTYQVVFGKEKTYGLLSGNQRDMEKDFLFSTMQMMAKEEIHALFSRDAFDFIVIDEAHRIGSKSYQKIMHYFHPRFWFGMTASPERTDDFDVYAAFDHTIVHEIRLQEALEEDLLCPFHYFGITDIYNDQVELKVKDFRRLASDQRVNYVIQQAEFYGYSGSRVKGLIFCSSKKEASLFSEKMNELGYKTMALSGEDSQEKREEAIERLVSGEEDHLDYILTVDIFNEGVDIPEINQVLLLRETESPIVFVQQLGRGLRKAKDKEYVIILDFIGNYKNNYMIPIALSGDRSFNKDAIRRYVMEGCRVIPGASTIHFDQISKSEVFKSIDKLNGLPSLIKQNYAHLKQKLNRVPLLIDFLDNQEVDPLVILDKYDTYPNFIRVADKKEYKDILSEDQKTILTYYSRLIPFGKRPHETELLFAFITGEEISYDRMYEKIESKYHLSLSQQEYTSALSNVSGYFVMNKEERKKNTIIQSMFDKEKSTEIFSKQVQGPLKTNLMDLIQVSQRKLEKRFAEQPDLFLLYERYSRRDVCQLLNLETDQSSTMYGMKRIDQDANIFVTYHKLKAEDGSEYIGGKPNYADGLENRNTMMWDSKIGMGISSKYMEDVINAKRIRIFIKKNDDEGNDYYYMGLASILNMEESTKIDNQGVEKAITHVRFHMETEVREDLYDYLEHEENE